MSDPKHASRFHVTGASCPLGLTHPWDQACLVTMQSQPTRDGLQVGQQELAIVCQQVHLQGKKTEEAARDEIAIITLVAIFVQQMCTNVYYYMLSFSERYEPEALLDPLKDNTALTHILSVIFKILTSG